MTAYCFFASQAFAQQHELGITIGAANPDDVRTTAGVTDINRGFALQFDYSGRIFDAGIVALYGNTPFAMATNNTIDVPGSTTQREYRSYFFTPGFKLKVVPKAWVSPYVVGGFGFARISPRGQSGIDDVGDVFDLVREFSPAYSFGGGVDVRIKKHIAIRGEVRRYSTKPFDIDDFISVPGLDLGFLEERQHSLFVTGGVVFRF